MATPEKRIFDADRAREVLENSAFEQVFDAIKQEYMNAWMNSPARDAEGREELWKLLKLTDKLKITLEAMLTDGKMARAQLDYESRKLAQERAEGVLTG